MSIVLLVITAMCLSAAWSGVALALELEFWVHLAGCIGLGGLVGWVWG